MKPAANGVDVDIVFRVEERRTGNINFGASLGQGTGVGGFLGLEEPNLFGRGKRGKLQWQFGSNINDFTLSYTDPAIKESRISGTVSLFDSRARYTIGDLGQQKRTGGSVQLGFPFLGSRYTRLFTSYSFQRVRYSGGSEDLRPGSTAAPAAARRWALSVLRDTRFGLPFATGGSYANVSGELNGGILGGTGNYRKVDLEGKWYAPLGSLGGGAQLGGGGVQFVLGLTTKAGFIFGDAGPVLYRALLAGRRAVRHPPAGLRRVLDHAQRVRPNGEQQSRRAPTRSASRTRRSPSRRARGSASRCTWTRSSMPATCIARARQWDPTRLFRGAGFGAAVVSPLGPIGVDLGYGFDKVDGPAFRRRDGNCTSSWAISSKRHAPFIGSRA